GKQKMVLLWHHCENPLLKPLFLRTQNESVEVVFVRFTSRETDCPAGGDKVWHECDYLQQTDKVRSHEPAASSKVAPCLGCPEKIDLYHKELRAPLIHSLAKANGIAKREHLFIFNDFTSATKQVVAGFRYKLQFLIEKSNCTRAEFKVVTEECHPNNIKLFFCNSTVDVAPWRHEGPEVYVECETVSVTRFKRPPGWSPLRIKLERPKDKESSEESKESISTTQPTPLNCPTKPWKEFKPVIASIAPPNTIESSQNAADSAFIEQALKI
uniref:Kininogen 1 n=1 Tax=Cyprinus carpio TaxID=7962 RepID=A0A8C1YBJ8_CYPCA